VRIESEDCRSRLALLGEGWRQVGVLVTYRGSIYRNSDRRVKLCRGIDVIEIADEIRWTGRLWRDPRISSKKAWSETMRFIEKSPLVYRIGHAAFIIADDGRVKLIGVHPVARGLGLGRILMRDCFDGQVTAGTYDDNDGARRLYESLQMRAIKFQTVFHK